MTALPLEQLVVDIVDEQLETVIEKHSAIVALTPSWAVKIYDFAEDADRRRSHVMAEHAWLSEHGTLSVRLHEDAERGPRFAAIVMERLPDAGCVGRRMVERTICARDIGRVLERIDELHATARRSVIDAVASAEAVLRNVTLQLHVLGEVVPGAIARDVRRRTEAAVSRWQASRAAPATTTVVHANLFGPNIFLLPDRCVLIDPGLRNKEARTMPGFTEVAPLIADLVLHDLAHLLPTDAPQHDGASRELLRVAVFTKVLVRLRFAILEQDRSHAVSWVADQNTLIRETAIPGLERFLDSESTW